MRFSSSEVKNICRLAWPAVLQEALATVVTYVDTAMVGSLGANASAAVGLTGTINWLVMSLAGALGVGVLSVCAQADGAKDFSLMRKAGQQALFITIILGAVLMAACLGVSPYIATWLGGDTSILKDATDYFIIISVPMVFRTAVVVLSSALRGVSDMKTPMYISLFMNLVNMVLNFLLIYPTRVIKGITVYGAGWGVQGAAIATAISFVVGGVLIFVCYYKNRRFEFKNTGFHFDREVSAKCMKIGTPVAVQRGIICFGHVVFSAMIATLGVIPFAAHTIAIQAEQAFYIPGYGLQSAAATLAGNAVGEKDEGRVKSTTYTICFLAFSLMFIAGAVLFVFAPAIMSFFTPDAEVVRMGTGVLRIVSVSEPLYGVLVILEGVFNGMGDTKAPVVYSIITMWGVRVLGSFLMINVFSLGLQSVWVMMVADNVSRCIMLGCRFLKGKWKYCIQANQA